MLGSGSHTPLRASQLQRTPCLPGVQLMGEPAPLPPSVPTPSRHPRGPPAYTCTHTSVARPRARTRVSHTHAFLNRTPLTPLLRRSPARGPAPQRVLARAQVPLTLASSQPPCACMTSTCRLLCEVPCIPPCTEPLAGWSHPHRWASTLPGYQCPLFTPGSSLGPWCLLALHRNPYDLAPRARIPSGTRARVCFYTSLRPAYLCTRICSKPPLTPSSWMVLVLCQLSLPPTPPLSCSLVHTFSARDLPELLK